MRWDEAFARALPSTVGPESRHRARILVALCAVLNLVMAFNIPIDAAHRDWGAVIIQVGWGAVVDVLLVHALKRGKVAAMGHFVSGLLVVNLTIIAQQKGGLIATEVAWQCAAIIFATLVLGPRGAFLWTLAAAGALVLHVHTFDPTQWHGKDVSFRNPVAFGVDLASLYLATWGLAYAFDRARAEFFRRLERRSLEMRRVLDHASDALLTIDIEGRIGPERSRRADELLELDAGVTGVTLWQVLGADPANAERAAWLQLSWEAVLDDVLPRELALAQMPARVGFRGRALDLGVTVIEEGGVVRGALVVLHDVTEELARERAEQARREVLAVFEHVRTDPSAVIDFITEMDRLVSSALHGTDGAVVMRDIHTVKGNAALFGVESLSTLCHEIEGRCAIAEIPVPGEADRALLARRWSELASELREWSGTIGGDRLVPVARTELGELRRALENGASAETVAAMVARWELTPIERVFARVARHGDAIARKLGKDVSIRSEVEPPSLRVDTEVLAPVLSSLVHAIRNAVDHGVATPDERVATGKPPCASIVLRARVDEWRQVLVLEVSDDGEGIAWDAVRRKALARGLPAVTEGDLLRALISDGFSTRDDATDTSGRGVGLASIRQASEDLGGSMTVISDGAKGTRTCLELPLAAATRCAMPPPSSRSAPIYRELTA